MMYRETGKQHYLDQTQKIAEFIINHPRLPEDIIPVLGFRCPGYP